MSSVISNVLSSLVGSQYSIGELMNIDSGRQERSTSCSVSLVNTYHEVKKESVLDKFKSALLGKTVINTYYVIFKFKVVSSSGKSYIVIIKTNPDFDLKDWANNKVQIYCNCPDFKFRSAYILNKRKSLFYNDKIKTYLGEALSNVPKSNAKTSLLCKHSFAALQWLTNNYANIMRNI